MKAAVGDRIVLSSTRFDHPTRDGQILEVRGRAGAPPYLVEWSDNGHRGVVFPGPNAQVQHVEATSDTAPAATRGVTRSWRVDLTIEQRDDETTAHATLVGSVPGLAAEGRAHAAPFHHDVPDLGPEVAAARALRQLADELLAAASGAVGEIENAAAALQPR